MFHEKKRSGTKSEKLRSFEKEEACRASMYQAKKKNRCINDICLYPDNLRTNLFNEKKREELYKAK